MTDRTAARLAWFAYGVAVAITATGVVIAVAHGGLTTADPDGGFDKAVTVSLGLVGALVASRRRDNVLGWLLLGISLLSSIEGATGSIALVAMLGGHPSLARWPAWLWNWVSILIFPAGLLPMVILLFPNGRLLSRRWRWPIVLGWVFTVVMVLAGALGSAPVELTPAVSVPAAIGAVDVGALDPFWAIGLAVLVAAVVGLIRRAVRARGRERQQVKWFAYVIATTCAALVVMAVVTVTVGETAVPDWMWTVVLTAGFGVGLPVAFAIAIFGHGLYEIDVVIRKTVVYGAFALFATVIYLGVVVGAGVWLGRDNSFLTMVAAVVVAVTFQPARARLTRFANLLVYGRRATPYEVLSEFSERLGGAYADEDVLPRMARILGEGIAAERADVWLAVDRELRDVAAWPSEEVGSSSIPLPNGSMPRIDGMDRVYPVEQSGELLGALAVRKPASDPVTPADEKLIADLASQAGLVLRNVRLGEALRARLEDLKAAQKRLVTAQDEERRRLERNIHDGAQQQLVALAVKLKLADALIERDAPKARELVGQLQGETHAALEDLRDLARGIYPPLLADKGLPAALESQARKSVLPIEVHADGIGRYPQDIEAAVYFSCMEAMQNIAKYASASSASVSLTESDHALRFIVTDDGRGFDPVAMAGGTGLQGIADRVGALDGRITVTSSPGHGTTIEGQLPVPVVAGAPA